MLFARSTIFQFKCIVLNVQFRKKHGLLSIYKRKKNAKYILIFFNNANITPTPPPAPPPHLCIHPPRHNAICALLQLGLQLVQFGRRLLPGLPGVCRHMLCGHAINIICLMRDLEDKKYNLSAGLNRKIKAFYYFFI